MQKPIVASYCTTFLKPEMLHIYRQVTGLQRYRTFVLAKERVHADRFPFDEVELIPKLPLRYFAWQLYTKHLRRLPSLYYRGEMDRMLKIFSQRTADLMHIYFGHTGVHLLPFIRHWDRPCIVSFHGADVMLRPEHPKYENQLRELLRIVPIVLARSRSLVERLAALGCAESKLRLNRTGIPLGDFPYKQRLMPADGEWRFVQACRLIPKKGLKTSLQAFALFNKANPKATFVIAGEGPMRDDLEKMIASLGLQGAVELCGFLQQKELCEVFHKAHVFLHPSEMTADQNQEGVPNSMLEAMSTGLPVLATKHGGIPEAVTDGESGFLVPERDYQALFGAMNLITESADHLCVIGRAAAQSVAAQFEHGAQIAKLETYYDEARSLSRTTSGDKGAPR